MKIQDEYGVVRDMTTEEESDWLNQLVASEPDPAVIESARIDRLWQAAHDYEYAQVSGSTIGLLAIGVMQGKPKCTAVQAWIKEIWNGNYYPRKANGSTDYDFSNVGPIPHTVPELMEEMGL